jgi:hypothetical protein
MQTSRALANTPCWAVRAWAGRNDHLAVRHLRCSSQSQGHAGQHQRDLLATPRQQNVSEEKFGKIQYDRVHGGFMWTRGQHAQRQACTTANTTYSTVMPVNQHTRNPALCGATWGAVIISCVPFCQVRILLPVQPQPRVWAHERALMSILFGDGFKLAAWLI